MNMNKMPCRMGSVSGTREKPLLIKTTKIDENLKPYLLFGLESAQDARISQIPCYIKTLPQTIMQAILLLQLCTSVPRSDAPSIMHPPLSSEIQKKN